jgi:hypothetical protein
MEQLIKDVNRFIEICRKLKQAGYKKKDIASVMDIPAPVLSSLLKTVLPSISHLSNSTPEKELEARIADAFLMVNNLSRTKIVKRLPSDIEMLTNLLENNDFKRDEKSGYLNFIRQQAEFSYNYISKYFQGIYLFYYISSDTDQLKADPFMIKPNIVEKIVEVYKGNEQSSVRCFGIALLNNNHTINMQLAENHESPEEYMQILLSLPFIRQVEYLRGIFSNLNFARQPIARKVVLHKISDQCDTDFFNSLQTKRFSQDELEIQEIWRYLHAEHAKTECFAIAKPCFNFGDLDHEINIVN